MKKTIFLLVIIISSCSRPLYIKDKHFNCLEKEFVFNSDLKELVYLSLKRAVVTEKDIQDYWSIWKKHRIYVASEYHTERKHYQSRKEWEKDLKYITFNAFPSNIENVRFCLKTTDELQKISNRTGEDFLHISFDHIIIKGNTATIKIDNSWIASKGNKKVYLSGGGYISIYNKINGKWRFNKILSRSIS